MTVINNPARDQYIATNGQTIFNYTFEISNQANIQVYKRAASAAPNDTADILLLTTDYTVTGVGVNTGGTIILNSGAALNDIISLQGNAPPVRSTSFTPGGTIQAANLNTEFDNEILIYQTILAELNLLTPKYPKSAIVHDFDVVLPVLTANTTWAMNAAGTHIVAAQFPSEGAASKNGTYVTLTDETAQEPNSFPLDAIGSAFMVNVVGTNSIITRALEGTVNQIDISNVDGQAGNPAFSISQNPVLPGTAGMGIPIGTTAQRVTPTPPSIGLRYNTDLQLVEYYDGAWVSISNDAALLALLASHTAGEGASLIGLEGAGTVQDFVESANFIIDNADPLIPNGKTLASFVGTLLQGHSTVLDDVASGALRPGHGAAATMVLQAYDVDGAAYVTFGTLTSNNTPTFDLNGLTTMDGGIIYHAGGAVVPLSQGGTNKALTASVGGLVYTDVDSMEILAGLATANHIPLSGATAAPTWSTMTYLNTIGINQIPYASAADTLNVIAAVNSAVLISSAGGVPSMSTVLPGGLTTTDPTLAQGLATKNYVDQTSLSGTSVYAATTATLNATQAGAGVGATLTDASGTFAAFSVDGTSPPLGSDILDKDQAAAANQGIYTLTRNGDGISIPWQLTRKTGYDTAVEVNNTGLIVVRNGTQAGQAWYNTTTIITVDTTAFNFATFGSAGTVTSVTFTGDGVVLSSTPSSAVTTSGTLTAALKTQTANTVLAGATSGGAATPTFRALVAADMGNTLQTYTPTITLTGGAGNVVPVYTTNSGRYVVNGKMTTVWMKFEGDGGAEGAGTGIINVTLPFQAGASRMQTTPAGVFFNNAAGGIIMALINANATVVTFQNNDSGQSSFLGNQQDNTNRQFNATFCYETV